MKNCNKGQPAPVLVVVLLKVVPPVLVPPAVDPIVHFHSASP
jgi:hypothetical protein